MVSRSLIRKSFCDHRNSADGLIFLFMPIDCCILVVFFLLLNCKSCYKDSILIVEANYSVKPRSNDAVKWFVLQTF